MRRRKNQKPTFIDISSSEDDYSSDEVVFMDINVKHKSSKSATYNEYGMDLKCIIQIMHDMLPGITFTEETAKIIALSTYFRIIQLLIKSISAYQLRVKLPSHSICSMPKIGFCVLRAEEIAKKHSQSSDLYNIVEERDISTYVDSILNEQKWRCPDDPSRKFPKNLRDYLPQTNTSYVISTKDILFALKSDKNISKSKSQELEIEYKEEN
ncbi:hypothetical protein TVAG_347950 [Trichomonas vaginalis G3]|uniref:Uncharacterized protein n=1 Tax=Trichomonas vaginalis (strain ATCC PRA-98 / G3) TaxID=412133 RepID=A2DST6_TRIV3|nr:hypothetical protein TVAGG3_0962470 [Trichomonas vaginalis G3]EAY16485.1 hypothetical protein TVAG_347950 [Trichomonas vaginalis G3]KAI5488010.1 hypothetical protein TVAGG3_0962470 [Trichomonas vaginalis G3]|eukprot:XP_001328708.1 hypothetical protein [Trichomonas vaginalis G3]